MLTILPAIKKWHPYLIGRHFKVKTGHDSLKYFLEQRLSSKEQQKLVTKMLGYDFEIIYKKGKKYCGKCILKERGRQEGFTMIFTIYIILIL